MAHGIRVPLSTRMPEGSRLAEERSLLNLLRQSFFVRGC